MAYSYDRTARKMRHRQRGKAKRLAKKRYKRKRQALKQKSKAWRRMNKAKIKRYEKRRQAQPSMYRLLPAKKATLEHSQQAHPLFNPIEDISLKEQVIEFWDPSTDTPDIGFVDWIDLDREEVHTIFIRDDGQRFLKTFELFDFMDTAALMYEDDEEALLTALDEVFGDEEDDEIAFQVAARYVLSDKTYDRFEFTQPVMQKLLQRAFRVGTVTVRKELPKLDRGPIPVIVLIKGDPELVLQSLGYTVDSEKLNLGGYLTALLEDWVKKSFRSVLRSVLANWEIQNVHVSETTFSGWARNPDNHEFILRYTMTLKK